MKLILIVITIISASSTLARTGDVLFEYEVQQQAEILMQQGRIPSNTNENLSPQGHEEQGENNEKKEGQ